MDKHLSKNLLNLLQYLTIKNLGFALLGSNLIILLIIFFQAIYNAYLKFKLKKLDGQNKNLHLKLNRRNIKNGRYYNLKFDEKLVNKFKSRSIKNGSTMISNLENLMLDYINKGNK